MTENQVPVAPPKLRGWFHLGATPAVIIASLVLFILSKESLKFAVALYSITAIMLFSVSAVYHRVPWSPAKKKIGAVGIMPISIFLLLGLTHHLQLHFSNLMIEI